MIFVSPDTAECVTATPASSARSFEADKPAQIFANDATCERKRMGCAVGLYFKYEVETG
jgi:hypothetical protein